MYDWKKIYALIVAHKKELVLVQILALLAVLVSIPTPLLMPLLVDEVLLHKPGRLLAIIDALFGKGSPLFYTLVVLAATLLLRSLFVLFNILQSKIFHTIAKDITYRIRKDVMEHLSHVSMSEYELLGGAAVASRLVSDINTIDAFLSSTISRFLISVLTLAGVSVVLLMIHWQLGLFILLLNPFVVLFSTKVARKVARFKKEENRAIELFQNALTETLDLFEQIRVTNKERLFFGRVLELAKALKQRSIDFSYKSEAGTRLSFLLFVGGFEIFRAAGIITVAYSDLSIGLMLAIFGYLWFMMTPIQDLINIQYAKKSADVALDRINKLLQLSQEPVFAHRKNPFTKKEPVAIEVRNLRFWYTPSKEVLKDISLTIPAGKISALVGASGSGKTTLSRLLVGLYAPSAGDILYDGVSIRDIGLDVVRKHVALVLQTPLLFNDTLRFNLTLGEEIEDAKIFEALKLVKLDTLVSQLPDGLQTQVGRGGVRLSGGERQRVALARMVLQDPKIVILDESTSAIDMETEKLIFCNLSPFFKERTTVLIAHRPSTIEEADVLFFLQDGKVARQMPFEEYKKNLCIL